VTRSGRLSPTTSTPGDTPAAEAAIRDMFATLINPQASTGQRQQIVTGPIGPQGVTEWQQATPEMVGASVIVYKITFTSDIAAAVVFQFFYNGGPSPIFPDPIDGGVIYSDGHWRIDQATGCSLALVAGYSCGVPGAKPPTTDTVPR
jgi:hypothetical protein